jgi:ribonuclease Z
LGYVIEEKPRRGNYNMKKVHAAGLSPGVILGELSAKGSLIIDGREITAESLMDPPKQPRKIVILGDTCDPSAIAPIAMDADVLVHEATNLDEERTVAFTYMHSTAGMAGAFAKRINAKNLILTHFSPRNMRGNEYDECVHVRTLVEQARRTFGKPNVFPAHVIQILC